MKIAILSFEYPPETGFGGIGTYSYTQARALAKLGHEVHVFAGAAADGETTTESDGVRVTRFRRTGWMRPWLEMADRRRLWWFKNRVETASNMYRALGKALHRGERFDVVEMPECGGEGALANALLPIRAVVRFHSPAALIMGMYDTRAADRRLTAFVERLGIDRAWRLSACSRFMADEVRAKMGIAPPVEVVPNGIDLDLFDRDEGIDAHARFGIPRDRVTVFFSGRMERRKGIHLVRAMAVHALARRGGIAFVFAGRDLFGTMEREILPWARENRLGDAVRYLGPLDLPAVRACLKQTDVFLLPSLWENCPYACLEAMAAGRAIVSSDCGGMPELLRDGENGLLARNGDPDAFCAALDRVIDDRDLRARLGRAARRTVEEGLTDVGIARRTVEFYRREGA